MAYDDAATNDNDIPIMRYAEVLLNYAEAKAELGELTDADWAATIGALVLVRELREVHHRQVH